MKEAEEKLSARPGRGAAARAEGAAVSCSRPRRSTRCRSGPAAAGRRRWRRRRRACSSDLADLFEQELDKMANQLRDGQPGVAGADDQQVDELLEKLKELARRQEQEAERQRRRALEGQSVRRRQQRRSSSVRSPTRWRKRRAGSRSWRVRSSGRTSPKRRGRCARRPTRCGVPRPAATPAPRRRRRRRSSGCVNAEQQLQRSLTQRAERRHRGRAAAGRGDRPRAAADRRDGQGPR